MIIPGQQLPKAGEAWQNGLSGKYYLVLEVFTPPGRQDQLVSYRPLPDGPGTRSKGPIRQATVDKFVMAFDPAPVRAKETA